MNQNRSKLELKSRSRPRRRRWRHCINIRLWAAFLFVSLLHRPPALGRDVTRERAMHFAIAAVAAEAADGVAVAVAVGAGAVAGAGNANAIECGSASVHCLCRFWPAFWPEFGFGLLAHFG